MSGLLDSLSVASRALDVQRMGMDVIGQNIANVNTPGYTKRTLSLTEVGASDPTNAGGGVTVESVTAARDPFVESSIRVQSSAVASQGAVADSLSAVETALGQPGSSIDASISSFYDAWSTLANDPTSASSRDAVVSQGQTLATDLNTLAGQLSTAQLNADEQVRSGVDQINRLTTQIASINAAIAQPNADADTLKDQLTTVLGTLAGLANVNVTTEANGTADVSMGNGLALVQGANATALGVTPSGPQGLAQITLGDQTITSDVTGGSMGGQLQVRDTLVPGYQQQLDQLAFDLGTQVNAQQKAGFDATGTAGGDFFSLPASAAGAAAAITVDPTLAANSQLVAASSTGAVGDNQNALAMVALQDQPTLAGGTASAAQLWSQLVYNVGADASDAQSAQTTSQAVLDQLTTLRDATSGVSIDDQAAMLMQYQRAYEATARYFSTISTTLDALMAMVTS
jgi:flagellar hook-associated protein 1 FlgK